MRVSTPYRFCEVRFAPTDGGRDTSETRPRHVRVEARARGEGEARADVSARHDALGGDGAQRKGDVGEEA